LSPPADAFGAGSAASELRRSGLPILVIAAEGNEPFASEARAIADAAGARAVIVTGDRHGTGVFRDHPELMRQIVAFCDDAVDR
jgi:hypothetical protein